MNVLLRYGCTDLELNNIYLFNKQHLLPPLRGWHTSYYEMSKNRRLVKLKYMKKRNVLLSCEYSHRRISALPRLHKAVASHNYSISSRSRVHPPDIAPCIPHHKPPPYTPIMQHSPCLPDIQTSFFQAILHGLNPPLPRPTL